MLLVTSWYTVLKPKLSAAWHWQLAISIIPGNCRKHLTGFLLGASLSVHLWCTVYTVLEYHFVLLNSYVCPSVALTFYFTKWAKECMLQGYSHVKSLAFTPLSRWSWPRVNNAWAGSWSNECHCVIMDVGEIHGVFGWPVWLVFCSKIVVGSMVQLKHKLWIVVP